MGAMGEGNRGRQWGKAIGEAMGEGPIVVI